MTTTLDRSLSPQRLQLTSAHTIVPPVDALSLAEWSSRKMQSQSTIPTVVSLPICQLLPLAHFVEWLVHPYLSTSTHQTANPPTVPTVHPVLVFSIIASSE